MPINALDVAYAVAAVGAAPWILRKRRAGWRERFGFVETMLGPVPRASDAAGAPGPRPRVLLHAVSVGEAAAIRELVPILARDADVIVSTTTDTGLQRARDLYGTTCEVVRYPLDFSPSVRRFLDAVRPDAVGLVELELWPNFLGECGRRGIPVAVINGRLSERSFRGYRRFRRWVGPMFGRLAVAGVQDEAYAERFRAMGMAADRVRVTGSMKWDTARIADGAPGAEELAREMGIDPGRPLVVGASTGPGEEALLERAVRQAAEAGGPAAQLLCAPRKPERFDEAAAALPGCVRRSRRTERAEPGDVARTGGRFLLDTIGELSKAYALADVVVIGRTFGAQGGSDPIEPVGLGKPVIVGPDTANFAVIARDLESAGGIVRTDAAGLAGEIRRLLGDPGACRAMAERGRALIRERQGASARHAALLLGMVRSGGAGA